MKEKKLMVLIDIIRYSNQEFNYFYITIDRLYKMQISIDKVKSISNEKFQSGYVGGV